MSCQYKRINLKSQIEQALGGLSRNFLFRIRAPEREKKAEGRNEITSNSEKKYTIPFLTRKKEEDEEGERQSVG